MASPSNLDSPTIQTVVFDVGETLVDESREYGSWADWLGVPRHTFSATFGAVIASGADYRDTFQVFRPGFNLTAEREARADAGAPESFGESDLYTDARPTLAALQASGLVVGIAGNQTARAEMILHNLNLPADWITTSEHLGVEKPSPEFFAAIASLAGCETSEILYVGDRLDNDIAPAQAMGMATVLIRRGPWGHILHDPDTEARCLATIASLSELVDLLANG
ncbi:HAD family hydrolase [Ferrimicrobium acidiphilum]|uniref:HAD family hydrolase n=1 Tax=Ferrimicrobium acidiphilum TaxID=121039 RepID=UPI0023F58E96|nr:HAD family hydrolase [Ferrimicrobium acidiphilum]